MPMSTSIQIQLQIILLPQQIPKLTSLHIPSINIQYFNVVITAIINAIFSSKKVGNCAKILLKHRLSEL